jgi:hypothetical protein
VCLGIVVDDTIHLMHAVRHARGDNLQATIAAALRKVLASDVLTNLILVIGFGAFMSGAFVPNQNFGLISVVILGIGLVFDLVFLPALMFVLSARGERVREAALVGSRQPT